MDKTLLKKVCENIPDVRPDGFGITGPELVREKGVSPHYAKKVLDEMVQAGFLEQKKMLCGKSIVTVYFEGGKKK